MSDDARADFTVMKDVAVHTRIAPAAREQTLTAFIAQIRRYLKLSLTLHWSLAWF